MARGIRPGDDVMHCGMHCRVASVYHGEAELTTLSGTLIDYIPVRALHRIKPQLDRRELDAINLPDTTRGQSGQGF